MKTRIISSIFSCLLILGLAISGAASAADKPISIRYAAESTAKDMGPEPEWNCPNIYEFCATMVGCPAGAFYIGADALTKAWGTGYTVEPVDDDEWYPKEWVIKHPHGTVSPASGFPFPCSIDQTHRNESELKSPDYHCAAFYQEPDHLAILLISASADIPCMGWAECICY